MIGKMIDKDLLELWGHNDGGGTWNLRDILAYFESLDLAGRAVVTPKLD